MARVPRPKAQKPPDAGIQAAGSYQQEVIFFLRSSGLCLFTSFALDAKDYADALSAATGLAIDEKELLKIGERIWDLQKLFNIKLGFTRADDTLPKRLLTEPLAEGAPKGRVWRREPLLDEYYAARGWDSNGVPTQEKLKELGLA